MYESVVSSVRVNDYNTEFCMSVWIEARVTYILSPGPFSMLINEIAVELSNVGQCGIQLQTGA